jgi:DNA-binding response OmpR family regulator/anti-sigma regulatory factor (Ser/Thr protein kinase)
MELDRQPGDLASVTERAAEAFRSKAEQKEIDLRVERPADRIEARFDPEKVETIVSNLVGNAVKFTPEGGTVVVRVEAIEATASVGALDGTEVAARTVQITVEDTGPGIDPAAQEAIFDRFGQADTSTTRPREGTGLGLALTRELVELHGGTIEIDSEPGAGSTFTVRLPRVPVAKASPDAWERGGVGDGEHRGMGDGEHGGVGDGEHGSVEAWGDGSGHERERGGVGERKHSTEANEGGATILIVEDNAEMRAYLREELSRRWDVREAADGAAGWQAAREEEPDLVLSDVMMPEMGGFELCRRIKAEDALRTIPVLLLTARADEEATLEGLDAGADDYVAKPFGPEELRRRIANHLAARRHLEARYREEVEIQSLEAVVDAEARPFVEKVLRAIEEHLSDPDFGVDDLAEAVALSRRQLTRRLKKVLDITPGDLIQQRRLGRARQMLEAGPETVAEVAYAVGFRSPSHFSTVFRQEQGTTPSEYIGRHADK